MNYDDIFHALRQWRNEKAFSEGKQPFMIFNNATLKATAETQPSQLDQLPNIKGWGPAKIQKYGHEILELLEKISTDTTHNTKDPQQELINTIPERSNKHILSVDECINVINKHLNELVILQVQGEINDISKRNRYAFFNLKDKSGAYTLPCFIGWHNFEKYKHLITEGTEVMISASASIYKTGRFSMDIKRIEPIGQGALKKAFEELKKKLEIRGYFDTTRKQTLPQNPTNIGLITSQHGAAIKDFKQNLKNFGFKIFFEHVYVEGDNAVPSINEAIQRLNINHPELDIIVLIRGGGGLENLKAFNEQEIADAIISSRLPIITGIGHEKDISIADLCADAYFSTPTATANFLSQQKELLIQQYQQKNIELISAIQDYIQHYNYEIDLQRHHLIQNYTRLISLHNNKITLYTTQLTHIVERLVHQLRAKHYVLIEKVNVYLQYIRLHLHKTELAQELLTQLNPKKLLEKGYSIVYNTKGEIIRSIKNVKVNDSIQIQVGDGTITTHVINKK